MFGVVSDPRQIERMPLAQDVSLQLRADVLEQAHKEFGYMGERFGVLGPLAQTLNNLSIEPLDTTSVKQYMKSKESTRSLNFRPFLRFWCILLPFLTAVAIVWGTSFFTSNPNVLIPMGIMSMLIIGLLGQLFTNESLYEYIDDKFNLHTTRTRSWNVYPLGNSTRYVPVHVLNYAIQIRAEQPSSSFNIYELTTNVNRVARPDPDPFMEVKLGSESYFIGVWDEREFEAKM